LREPGRRLRILLAEDSPVNQKLAVRMLEKWGHCVTVADNGRRAVTLFQEAGRGGFDLVLMDVQMPDMNGFEATAAVRSAEVELGSHVPIVAMTAHAMKGDRERCLTAGMDDYLSKPIDAAKLFELIDGVGTGEALESAAAPASRMEGHTWDAEAALVRVGGDEDLLRETVSLLLAELPKMIGSVHTALRRKDATGVERAAHKLKGSVGILDAGDAVRAARRLEELGRAGDLGEADAALRQLDETLERLTPALQLFTMHTSGMPSRA